MKALIFSGGSGPADLQKGLIENYPELELTFLINAYDNGKSTGDIRKHFNGQILGPSDVRKNQSRLYVLEGGNPSVRDFIEYRFNADNNEEALSIIELKAKECKKSCNRPDCNSIINFSLTVVKQFFEDISVHKKYSDYSIGNILYGQLAHENNNSLQKAADIMHNVLGLKSRVILNSDESLFLFATTESLNILSEEEIVEHNSEDRIKNISFSKADSKTGLSEEIKNSLLCARAVNYIKESDIIIFSTGTQWSSLMPTYQCRTENGETFRGIISNTKAKKYILINGKPDKDMIDLNGDDILDIINTRYFNVDDCIVTAGINNMSPSRVELQLKTKDEKYSPNILSHTIMRNYFHNPKSNDTFCFDWDNTITDNKANPRLQKHINFNKHAVSELKNTFIISGNTKNEIDIETTVYADGGVNKYTANQSVPEHLDEEAILSHIIINVITSGLTSVGLKNKISIRGNVCLTVKPISNEYREIVKLFLESLLSKEYVAHKTGRTTIDIMHKNNNKLIAMEDIIKYRDSGKRVFYIGDEFREDGNDWVIEKNKERLNIITIPVYNPSMTSLFLRSIEKE